MYCTKTTLGVSIVDIYDNNPRIFMIIIHGYRVLPCRFVLSDVCFCVRKTKKRPFVLVLLCFVSFFFSVFVYFVFLLFFRRDFFVVVFLLFVCSIVCCIAFNHLHFVCRVCIVIRIRDRNTKKMPLRICSNRLITFRDKRNFVIIDSKLSF